MALVNRKLSMKICGIRMTLCKFRFKPCIYAGDFHISISWQGIFNYVFPIVCFPPKYLFLKPNIYKCELRILSPKPAVALGSLLCPSWRWHQHYPCHTGVKEKSLLLNLSKSWTSLFYFPISKWEIWTKSCLNYSARFKFHRLWVVNRWKHNRSYRQFLIILKLVLFYLSLNSPHLKISGFTVR